MKVIINTLHGGFSLSDQVFARLEEMGWKVTLFDEETKQYQDEDADIAMFDSPFYRFDFIKLTNKEVRTHPDIIQVVEELGKDAFGDFAWLRIIDIPDDAMDWEIDSDDGMEHVIETKGRRRAWYK